MVSTPLLSSDMSDPAQDSQTQLYSGEVILTVCIQVDRIDGYSAEGVAEEAKESLIQQLSTVPGCTVLLEDHDLSQVNRTPDFWDKVDEAYDRKKNDGR